MALSNSPIVLIAPLDWGLGHATRCIPVIRELKKQGAYVIVGGSKAVLNRLREAGADKEVPLEGYTVTYSNFLPAWLSAALQYKSLMNSVDAEHRQLSSLIKKHRVSGIISDNRYGLFSSSKQIPSILITHQLQPSIPLTGLFQRIINRKMRGLINPFDEVWIPDLPRKNTLSGKLSLPFKGLPPVKYVGWLSRFENPLIPSEKKWDLLLLLSGPEPQKSIFRNEAIRFALDHKLKIAITSTGESLPTGHDGGILIHEFLNPDDQHFQELVSQSERILVRSGYSSLMDLLRLNRSAMLVPTPGQTEQEYLAKIAKDRFGFKICSQRSLKNAWADISTENSPVNYSEVNAGFLRGKALLAESISAFLVRLAK